MGYVFKSFFLFAKIEEDNILSNCSTEKVNEKKKKSLDAPILDVLETI